jgi:hypothetical protein
MRAFITLVTLFTLAFAWIPRKDVLNDAKLQGDSDLQFFASTASPHTDGVIFEEVYIPLDRQYRISGQPNMVTSIFEDFSNVSLVQWNETCSAYCERKVLTSFPQCLMTLAIEFGTCLSYFFFEALSGTPELPTWGCYLLAQLLAPSDFTSFDDFNFAHAYK